MNKNKTLIFAIIGVLLASTFAVAVNFAEAMPTNMANTIANRLLFSKLDTDQWRNI